MLIKDKDERYLVLLLFSALISTDSVRFIPCVRVCFYDTNTLADTNYDSFIHLFKLAPICA